MCDCGSRITNHESRLLWFVIQTKPLAENDVQLRLTRADIEVFYPKIKTVVRGKLRPIERYKSLFPAYIFARLDSVNPDVFHMVRYTRGVRRILGDVLKPVPIPDEAVAIIQKRVDNSGVLEQSIYKKGDSIRIRKGPFRDLIGILEKPVSAAGRVRVLLGIMNKVVSAEITCSDIERI